jgi:hypothetical protein
MSSLSGKLRIPGSAVPDHGVEDNQKLPQNIFELVLHTMPIRFAQVNKGYLFDNIQFLAMQ